MKKFALLLSSLAVVSSAFAVTPQVSKAIQKVSGANIEPISVSLSKENKGNVLSKVNIVKENKLPMKAPKKAEGFSVSYEEPSGIFALGFSEDGMYGLVGRSFRKAPAYTPLTWTNTSVGATEFEWEVIEDFATGTPSIYKTTDLTHSEVYSFIDGPILYGMDAAGEADVFQFGAQIDNKTGELGESNVAYYYGGDTSPDYNVPELGISTYMYGQNGTEDGFIGVGCMAYSKSNDEMGLDPVTGLYPVFTDKENGFGFEDPKFLGYANFFPAPAAPYLISKLWSWMVVTPNKPTVIEMTLYKVSDEGEVTDEIIAQGSCSLDPKDKTQWLIFDLYALDEDGLQTDDLIVIDSGVLAEMTFVVDDIEEVYPVAANGAVFPMDANEIPYPFHAYMLVEDEGEIWFPRTPYPYYYDSKMTKLSAITDWLWMMDAVFPWTYAIDGETQAQAPVEGGTVSFNISSYYGIEYFGYDVTDYVNGDCDWIDFETATVEDNEELQCQVLTLPVAALPEGVAGRSAIIDVIGAGTSLKLYVHQGESTGVNVVVSDKNAEYFDLQGRRVANPEKGIYIKKTGNKAEKVLL